MDSSSRSHLYYITPDLHLNIHINNPSPCYSLMQIHTAITQAPPPKKKKKNQHLYPTIVIRIISPELRISTPPPLAGGSVPVLSLSILAQFPTHGLLSYIQKNPHTFTILKHSSRYLQPNYIHGSLLRPWLSSLHANEKLTERKALWYLIAS